MKKFIFLASVVLVVTMACGVSFDNGGYQQPPQAPQSQSQQPVVITVVVPEVQRQPQQQQEQPVSTPVPPTPIPPTLASSGPVFTAARDLSCAEGPNWQLYWFVLLFREGESAEILAVNGDYGLVKVKGKECWVLLSEGSIDGSTKELPYVDAPPLPNVKFYVVNNLGVFIHLRFYEWSSGERIKQVDLNPGQSVLVKLPSGFYSLIAYDQNWNQIWGPFGPINLAVGDSNHIEGLETGESVIFIEP